MNRSKIRINRIDRITVESLQTLALALLQHFLNYCLSAVKSYVIMHNVTAKHICLEHCLSLVYKKSGEVLRKLKSKQSTKCLYRISYGGEVAGVKLV